MSDTKSFAAKVWDVLSRMDVSDHIYTLPATKKRPEVPYLPWHKAWMLVMRKFPASNFSYKDDIVHADQTMEVEVEVFIRETYGTDVVCCSARLAVMDSWFNAIPTPNARDINDARQRCLVKALSYLGLGLSLWDNFSKLPVGTLGDPINDKELAKLKKEIEATDSDMESFLAWAGVEDLKDVPKERYQSALRMLQFKAKS